MQGWSRRGERRIKNIGMQSYLELKVPIRRDAIWLDDLKKSLTGIPIRWQNGFYHITLAFLNETTNVSDVVSVIDDHIGNGFAPELVFDKVDVFTATTAGMHIINLTSLNVPESFAEWVDGLREDLQRIGCVMESGFRLHVTLGRADSTEISLEQLKEKIDEIHIPAFRLDLHTFEYRKFRDDTIKVWS